MLEVTIIGHLGKDAKIVESNGETFVSFNVASTKTYKKLDKDTGEEIKVEKTDWVTCTTSQLNLAPHLKSGTQVFARGNLSVKNYKDSDNKGQIDVQCFTHVIQLLSSKKKSEEKEESEEREADTKKAKRERATV